MKTYVLAALTFCMVIAFQNCARTSVSDTTANNALNNPAEMTAVDQVNVSQTSRVQVPDNPSLETELQPAIQQAQPTSALSSHHLEINVQTGVISVLDQNNNPVSGVEYCLTPQDLQNLTGILDNSQVCDGTNTTTAGSTCTMDYQFPYAVLEIGSAQISLGESTSGCQHGPDLCGAQKDLLQAFLGNLQSQLSTKTCNFQSVSN